MGMILERQGITMGKNGNPGMGRVRGWGKPKDGDEDGNRRPRPRHSPSADNSTINYMARKLWRLNAKLDACLETDVVAW